MIDISPTIDETGTRFAESGLLVRADTAVELQVEPSSGGQVRIGWGAVEPSTVVRVPRCPTPGPRWLAFAGGFWTNGPACVGMVVRATAGTEQARIGIGRGC